MIASQNINRTILLPDSGSTTTSDTASIEFGQGPQDMVFDGRIEDAVVLASGQDRDQFVTDLRHVE